MAFPQLERNRSSASIASKRDSMLSYNPAFEHTRSRRTSMPANLIQTRHQSMVMSSGSSTLRVKENKAANRLSVASFSSIESVAEEEDENGETVSASHAKVSGLSRRPRAVSRRTASPPASRPPSMARPVNPSRYSLPTSPYHGGYQSFSVALGDRLNGSKPSSPLSMTFDEAGEQKGERVEPGAEDRARREERRWRIAEELKETEKAYVQVLEEIDALYYQPLIAALPAVDPSARRSVSTRYSSAGPPASRSSSPTVSPRASVYVSPSIFASPRSRTSTRDSVDSTHSSPSTAPSTPPTPSGPTGPILNRREINEVFSNFTDVLNLSHVMLLAVDEAVPARPSKPVPVTLSPRSSASPLTASPDVLSKPASALVAGLAGSSSAESQVGELSTSAETTASSTGPVTPGNDGSPSPAPGSRARTTSTRTRQRSQAAAPPVRLGKALLPILPFLKQYSLFVANFSGSLARLSSLEAAPSAPVSPVGANGAPGSTNDDRTRWQAFAAEAQKKRVDANGTGSGKIGLGGLLLNIVQRVPRYKLLLADLIRYTEEDHPDLRDLKTAFTLVDGVASHLESQIQSHTNDLQILDLQRAFTNLETPLLSPGRRLLKSGTLRKQDRAGREQTRTFFLFNDILLHASGGESGWSAVGLGIANVVLGGEEGAGSAAVPTGGLQYRLHRRLELEDVTVIGSGEVTESGLKYGFEILSAEKSFVVFADSLESKTAWLDAIRDAKAALMSDRQTLQRTASVDRVFPAPPAISTSGPTPRAVKRISLPVPSSPSPLNSRPTSSTSLLAVPPGPVRQLSTAPQLGAVPPTPAEELAEPVLSFPTSRSAELDNPLPLVDSPVMLSKDDSTSIRSIRSTLDLGASAPASTAPTTRPRSLSRSRRWSEMHPSAAFQALASALSLTSTSPVPSVDELTSATVEYPIIEEYSAPVWYPNAKALRCHCCRSPFTWLRRVHHCRLCGSCVCWKCSQKYFIIPGTLLSTSASTDTAQHVDRLARACDRCYTAVFEPSAPSSRFLSSHPSADSTFLAQPMSTARRPSPVSHPTHAGADHRLSRILAPQTPDAPLFDFEVSSPPFKPVDEARLPSVLPLGEADTDAQPHPPRRSRKTSAVAELRKLSVLR
ncbi:hypothetical protein JCM8547_001321 [Rhodosporidiobolus lusitaniae]